MQQSEALREFWIFAGPNGSGKSTAYGRANVEGFGSSIWIINPDLLTARICKSEAMQLEAANLAAVQRLWLWLKATIEVHKSVGVETVLSTSKYRELVELAISRGFSIRLFYVILNSPELNVERVRRRVSDGGHSVPEDKIRDRYWRSLDQLPWFLDKAERASVFDNSGSEPQLIASKADGTITVFPGVLPVIEKAIERVRTGDI